MVEATEKQLEALHGVKELGQRCGITALSKRLGIHPTATRARINALAKKGYVRLDYYTATLSQGYEIVILHE